MNIGEEMKALYEYYSLGQLKNKRISFMKYCRMLTQNLGEKDEEEKKRRHLASGPVGRSVPRPRRGDSIALSRLDDLRVVAV